MSTGGGLGEYGWVFWGEGDAEGGRVGVHLQPFTVVDAGGRHELGGGEGGEQEGEAQRVIQVLWSGEGWGVRRGENDEDAGVRGGAGREK